MPLEVKYWVLAHVMQSRVAAVTKFTFELNEGVILKPQVLGSPVETLASTRILNFKPDLDAKIYRVYFCKPKLELEWSFDESYVSSHLNPFLGVVISAYRNGRFWPEAA